METRRRVAVAIVAVAVAFVFQALTVHYNYAGDWSGLFCIGNRQPQPPDLPRPYLFHDSAGYDGQFYRLIRA